MTVSILDAPLFVATVIATMAAFVAVMLAPLARGRPALRHLLWQGALVVALASAIAALAPLHPRIVLPLLSEPVAVPALARVALPVPARAEVPAFSWDDGERVALVLWLLGFAYVALRYALSAACASELRRNATRVDPERWRRLVAGARATLGYDGPLDLLVSREIDVPVVTGFWKPALLLPVAASEWSEADARLVCLHELAHVERGDHYGRAIAALAVALHWFNPVIWWLDARASMEAELAADAAVLRAGVRSTDYADMLISIAERTVWRPAAISGVALLRRPLLAARVHAILDASHRGAGIGRRQRRSAIATAALLAAATGSVRVRLVAAREAGATSVVRRVAVRADRVDAGAHPVVPQSRAASDAVVRTARRAAPRTSVAPEPGDPWTARAVAGLTDALDDPSAQVRAAAARSLSRLGGDASRRALEHALADTSTFVRDEARRALEHLAVSRGGR